MAYGNYGAYVWKNGKDVTKNYCDVPYIYKDKWILKDKDDEEECDVYSHAAIPITDDILLEFYKSYIIIHHKKDKPIHVDSNFILHEYKTEWNINNFEYIERKYYDFNYDNLIIVARELTDFIQQYEITYGGNCWLILIGGAFGNGYDEKYISKLCKNRVKFLGVNNGYIIKTKSEYEIDYICRKDDRHDIYYHIWYWHMRDIPHHLIRFNFHEIAYHFREIYEKLKDLKYLL